VAAVPFNLLTPTRWRRRPQQALGFWLARQKAAIAHLLRFLSASEQLMALDVLHSGRWVRLGLPDLPGFPHEPRRTRWILFTSNFVGDEADYVRLFMDSIPEGVFDLWAGSEHWPGFPGPGTAGELFRWVYDRTVDTQHHYAAYDVASSHDVRAALAVRTEVRSLVADLEHTDRSDGSPWTRDALRGLATRVTHCLGTVDPLLEPLRSAAGGGGPQGVVVLLPVRQGALDDVRSALGALDGRPDSPFSRVPGTHFARLALLGAGCGRPGAPTPEHTYLMLGADFDGELEPFLESVHEVTGRELWQHCIGIDRADPGEFARVAAACRQEVLVDFQNHDQRLEVVVDALATQRRLVELLADIERTPIDRSTFARLVGAG
jgi:hypothetical protein